MALFQLSTIKEAISGTPTPFFTCPNEEPHEEQDMVRCFASQQQYV